MINPSIEPFEANNVIQELKRQLAAKDAEITRLKAIMEQDLKRQVRLNLVGASEQRQQAAWENYKLTHKL